MFRKHKVVFLVIGLLAAGFALAQMGISNGGVTFPDGSVQTTASGTEYRIIGVTVATTDGSAVAIDGNNNQVFGINALNQLCTNEFGAGVRAAFSNEELAPFIEPSELANFGWVRPTSVRMVHDPDITTGNDWYPVDGFSGVAGSSTSGPLNGWDEIDCLHFASASLSKSGLYRLADGGVIPTFCESILPVACSARVQIPVYQPAQ